MLKNMLAAKEVKNQSKSIILPKRYPTKIDFEYSKTEVICWSILANPYSFKKNANLTKTRSGCPPPM